MAAVPEIVEKGLAKFVARVHSHPHPSIARRTCRRVKPLPMRNRAWRAAAVRSPGGAAPNRFSRAPRARASHSSSSGSRTRSITAGPTPRASRSRRIRCGPPPRSIRDRTSASAKRASLTRPRSGEVLHRSLRDGAPVPGPHELRDELGARVLPSGEQSERPPERGIRPSFTTWWGGHRSAPEKRARLHARARRAGAGTAPPAKPVPGVRAVRRGAEVDARGRSADLAERPEPGPLRRQPPPPPRTPGRRPGRGSGIIRSRSAASIASAVSGCSTRNLRALSRPCPMRSLP